MDFVYLQILIYYELQDRLAIGNSLKKYTFTSHHTHIVVKVTIQINRHLKKK